MRTDVPEKILAIIAAIDESRCSNGTRLTVLKKWFARAERLTAFGAWIASRAASLKGKTTGEAGQLFTESRKLLRRLDRVHPKLDRAAAAKMHRRLVEFQNEYKSTRYGLVRQIKNWNLMVVEKGLAIYLNRESSPSAGYEVAADYCRHYDSRYPESLTAGSVSKLNQLVRFMFTIEALEDES